MLDPALAEPANRRAMSSVHLQRQKIVAANAHVPARVEVGDDAAFEFESRVGRIVRRALVGLPLLVHALGDMGRTEAAHGFHFAEEIVQHVAPVAEHIHDNAAIVFFAVIPARALGGNVVAFENPVAKFTADAEDFSKEPLFLKALDFQHAGKPELVLHDTIFHAGGLGGFIKVERAFG